LGKGIGDGAVKEADTVSAGLVTNEAYINSTVSNGHPALL